MDFIVTQASYLWLPDLTLYNKYVFHSNTTGYSKAIIHGLCWYVYVWIVIGGSFGVYYGRFEIKNFKYCSNLKIDCNRNYVIPFSAKDDYNIDKESYHSLTISSDGSISRYFPTIYKSSCKLDVRNFPFDDQVTVLDENSNSF